MDNWLAAGPLPRTGFQPGGAVLVRPDTHVAWRSTSMPSDAAAALLAAFDTALRRATG